MNLPDHHVKSDVTAFRILETLERNEEMRITEIANQTGIRKSSVYKHLCTLQALGYVNKGEERYSLSLRWFETGSTVRDRNLVYEMSREEINRLSRLTGETVSLVVAENDKCIYIKQNREGKKAIGPVSEGEGMPIAMSVGGKAILSYLPESEVKSMLGDSDMVDDFGQFLSELRTLRNQRMVIERASHQAETLSAGAFEGHRHEGGQKKPYRNLNSIAVPIRDQNDYAVGAIELNSSEDDIHGRRFEEELTSLLINSAKSVETSLVQHLEND